MQQALDAITETVLQAELRGETIGPAAITFLLRRYLATGRDDIRPALERSLTAAIETHRTQSEPALAEWIRMFAEAVAMTDDPRVVGTIVEGVAALRQTWPSRGSIAEAMQTVDACLSAADYSASDLVPAAVDELERVVCYVYRPGEKIARSLSRPDEADGMLIDHVCAASALLTAYLVTGRLPYSMLAEELIRAARPLLDEGGFAAQCECARVFCRLAVLHSDAEYRAAAVIARDSDYRDEARRLLESLFPSYGEHGAAAAIYGVAIDDLARAS